MTKAVYPGTFDPMTLGHFDLIVRAAKLYDKLLVAVAATSKKQGALFDAEERIAMIREDVRKAKLKNVEVKLLDCLLVDFCRRERARIVIRGVRVYSDFEYEFQMALTNRRMAPEIETLFMMPSANLAYVTASTVREIASYGGDTSGFVTPAVEKKLRRVKHALALIAALALPFFAVAEKQPMERYQSVIDRQMFGPLPPNFDPTKSPSEVQSSRTSEKELSKEEEQLKSAVHFSVINVTPDGDTAVGFTDKSNAKEPKHYYLKVGEERDGWVVKEADPTESTMTIAKDGVEVSLKLGGDSSKGAGSMARAGGAARPARNGLQNRMLNARPSPMSLGSRRNQRIKAEQEKLRKEKEEIQRRAEEQRLKDEQRQQEAEARNAEKEEMRNQLMAIREELAKKRQQEAEKKAEESSEGGDENHDAE